MAYPPLQQQQAQPAVQPAVQPQQQQRAPVTQGQPMMGQQVDNMNQRIQGDIQNRADSFNWRGVQNRRAGGYQPNSVAQPMDTQAAPQAADYDKMYAAIMSNPRMNSQQQQQALRAMQAQVQQASGQPMPNPGPTGPVPTRPTLPSYAPPGQPMPNQIAPPQDFTNRGMSTASRFNLQGNQMDTWRQRMAGATSRPPQAPQASYPPRPPQGFGQPPQAPQAPQQQPMRQLPTAMQKY